MKKIHLFWLYIVMKVYHIYIYIYIYIYISYIITIYMKSSDAKASKCCLKFSYKMSIFIRLICAVSVISL